MSPLCFKSTGITGSLPHAVRKLSTFPPTFFARLASYREEVCANNSMRKTSTCPFVAISFTTCTPLLYAAPSPCFPFVRNFIVRTCSPIGVPDTVRTMRCSAAHPLGISERHEALLHLSELAGLKPHPLQLVRAFTIAEQV